MKTGKWRKGKMSRKKVNWQVFLGVILVLLSAFFYFLHYFIFHDVHHIFIYLVGDIAFVFLEVLLVTLVLHQLLHRREKKLTLNKLNMVIGVFFSEAGVDLLRIFSGLDQNVARTQAKLSEIGEWSEKHFWKHCKNFRNHHYDINTQKGSLKMLKQLLQQKRPFLLNLLENPNLLEHDSFTDLLWAIFHLAEELIYRDNLDGLSDNDYRHLAGDIQRGYQLLIVEWLHYLKHLKLSYPYLFSLAVRTNPFNSQISVEIK